MKKLILFTIAFLIAFQMKAQKREGIIILNSGDTIKGGLFTIHGLLSKEPHYVFLQYQVQYYDVGGKKIKIGPDDAKEFSFKDGGSTVRMLSKKNTIGAQKGLTIWQKNSNIFLHLKVDGKLKLFCHYETMAPSTLPQRGYIIHFILQKGDDELKRINTNKSIKKIKKELSRYLNDCPEVIQVIEKEKLKKQSLNQTLEEMVKLYNESCLQ